jgi:hypothetical protein
MKSGDDDDSNEYDGFDGDGKGLAICDSRWQGDEGEYVVMLRITYRRFLLL